MTDIFTKKLLILDVDFMVICMSCILKSIHSKILLLPYMVSVLVPLPENSSRRLNGDKGQHEKHLFSRWAFGAVVNIHLGRINSKELIHALWVYFYKDNNLWLVQSAPDANTDIPYRVLSPCSQAYLFH